MCIFGPYSLHKNAVQHPRKLVKTGFQISVGEYGKNMLIFVSFCYIFNYKDHLDPGQIWEEVCLMLNKQMRAAKAA